MSEGTKTALHDAAEAAVILKCTESWLKEQARRRLIPFTMTSGSYRWTGEHLQEIIRLREHRPAPPAPQPAVTPRAAGRAPAGSAVVPLLRARQPRRRPPAQAGAA